MTTKAKKRASHAHTDAEGAAHDGGRLIKYMGASHVRVLEAGEDFGGRLHNSPLPQRVEWNLGNNHMVNSAEVGLPQAAIDILLDLDGDQFDSGQWEDSDEDGYTEPSDDNTLRVIKEFRDVTDEEVITPSLAQQIFLGMSGHQTADEAIRSMESNITPPNPAAQSVVSTDGAALVSGSAEVEQTPVEDGNADSSKGDDASDGDDQSPSATTPTTTVGGSTDGSGGDQ